MIVISRAATTVIVELGKIFLNTAHLDKDLAGRIHHSTTAYFIWYGFYTPSVMTFYQFKYLSKHDQECLLWETGVEIARKTDSRYVYILFQVEGFYMEVQIIRSQRKIRQIACFEDTCFLEPYLSKINIDTVYHP